MPGVIPDGSAYLGNMEPGTSNSTEIYAFFGTLDMEKMNIQRPKYQVMMQVNMEDLKDYDYYL